MICYHDRILRDKIWLRGRGKCLTRKKGINFINNFSLGAFTKYIILRWVMSLNLCSPLCYYPIFKNDQNSDYLV